MFERCFNPDCSLPFDYREGRLIRVSSTDAKPPAERPSIEHLWLCGRCSERFVFPHEREVGMKIRLRVEEPHETAVRALAATVSSWNRVGYHDTGAIMAQGKIRRELRLRSAELCNEV